MDFLLECVGVPPDWPLERLVAEAVENGEGAVWRGQASHHRSLRLSADVQVLVERDAKGHWHTLPLCATPHRLRVAVERRMRTADTRFDTAIGGWVAPEWGAEPSTDPRGAWPIAASLVDARKLPPRLPKGHVLALEACALALDLSYVGDDAHCTHTEALGNERGAWLEPLGGADSPVGAMELSARVSRILRETNPLTHEAYEVLELDCPARPVRALVSQWQREQDELPRIEVGARIEGVFLFVGRVCGGLPGPQAKARGAFG